MKEANKSAPPPPPAAPESPKPAPWIPVDADRCEASPVSYQAKNGSPDAAPVAARCSRVWLVRVGGKKVCRSCAVLELEARP